MSMNIYNAETGELEQVAGQPKPPVDVVESGNLNAVTSNAVAEELSKLAYTNGNGTPNESNLDTYKLCEWQKYGNIVEVYLDIKLKSSCSSLWTPYLIFSNLPQPNKTLYHFGGTTVDDVSTEPTFSISSNGNLEIISRKDSIASRRIYSNFTYICK